MRHLFGHFSPGTFPLALLQVYPHSRSAHQSSGCIPEPIDRFHPCVNIQFVHFFPRRMPRNFSWIKSNGCVILEETNKVSLTTTTRKATHKYWSMPIEIRWSLCSAHFVFKIREVEVSNNISTTISKWSIKKCNWVFLHFPDECIVSFLPVAFQNKLQDSFFRRQYFVQIFLVEKNNRDILFHHTD